MKQKASASSGKEFPNYLTWKYCDDIKAEFMTVAIKSLETYSSQHLDANKRRGLRNTQDFLNKRYDWLAECDAYMAATGKGRIFKEEKTTEDIFTALQSVASELDSLAKGVTYANQNLVDTQIATEKFGRLFTLVDNHKNRLLLRGEYVVRR